MDNKKLFVAGLPWAVKDDDLRDLFGQYGRVLSAKVITDRDTGRSKGFGFVEFENAQDAQNAIDGLNNSKLESRTLVVNIARPQQPKLYQR